MVGLITLAPGKVAENWSQIITIYVDHRGHGKWARSQSSHYHFLTMLPISISWYTTSTYKKSFLLGILWVEPSLLYTLVYALLHSQSIIVKDWDHSRSGLSQQPVIFSTSNSEILLPNTPSSLPFKNRTKTQRVHHYLSDEWSSSWRGDCKPCGKYHQWRWISAST